MGESYHLSKRYEDHIKHKEQLRAHVIFYYNPTIVLGPFAIPPSAPVIVSQTRLGQLENVGPINTAECSRSKVH